MKWLSTVALALSCTQALAAEPLVIAHRGASGYRPEHTLPAYELAIDMGADFVEPDLVPTKDGVLVARHENEISTTTNVAQHPEFALRKTKKKIDGSEVEGWFTEDFTFAELRSLKARERMPEIRQHNMIYNDRYVVPSFQEIIDLVKKKEKEQHRRIGIYPEIKHPTYFAGVKLDTEQPTIEMLKKNGYDDATEPVYIQCFETATLKRLHKLTRLKLVLLLDEDTLPFDLALAGDKRKIADIVSAAGLAEISAYAQGIGPNKNLIVPRDQSGQLSKPTTLVADAHKAGLAVHPWTFRNENKYLPSEFRSSTDPSAYGSAFAEYKLFYSLGVDGLFSENPDTAIAAKAKSSD